ncbi:hypothetical protein [Mycobacteroides abscessus]|uniref:hypothetical protein n=1 Tax=Mycobacteroides abscessus TaxID=36809 RepID=UPI000C26AF05|nr:hypothetical protein [Mycobacteroides abscessus]
MKLLAIELHRILTEASHFAYTDSNLPSIAVVRLEYVGATAHNGTPVDSLIAAATDRFTIGVSRTKLHKAERGEKRSPFAVSIPIDAVKRVLPIAKTLRRDGPHRFCTITVDSKAAAITFAFTTGETITVATASDLFPGWRHLLTPRGDGALSAELRGYNGRYLARFAKIAGSEQMWVYTPTKVAPTVVSIGDHFVGLIMPIRSPNNQHGPYDPPAWAIAEAKS